MTFLARLVWTVLVYARWLRKVVNREVFGDTATKIWFCKLVQCVCMFIYMAGLLGTVGIGSSLCGACMSPTSKITGAEIEMVVNIWLGVMLSTLVSFGIVLLTDWMLPEAERSFLGK